MSLIRKAAQKVRHLPALERADWIWNRVRTPYHRLIDLRRSGVKISIGGTEVLVPAEYSGSNWEDFEPEAVDAVRTWLAGKAKPLVVDVGCSIGAYAAVSLFQNPSAWVIAIDADLSSVAATKRLCKYAPAASARLLPAWAMADEKAEQSSLDNALAWTEQALAHSGVSGLPGTTRYVCLGNTSQETPHCRLDDLLSAVERGTDMLLKIDIEGAELVALRGAAHALQDLRPTILLSVHPPALLHLGSSAAEVRQFLDRNNYSTRIIAVDHEEHWWCEAQ